MDTKMSQKTRIEVLAKKRDRYARAGKEHKTKIINELVELFDYHRKAAIRALQARPAIVAPFIIGRPKEYDPDKLRAPLKAVWLAALQPCGVRHHTSGHVVAPPDSDPHRVDRESGGLSGDGYRGVVRGHAR
jgi:hypothetical protein